MSAFSNQLRRIRILLRVARLGGALLGLLALAAALWLLFGLTDALAAFESSARGAITATLVAICAIALLIALSMLVVTVLLIVNTMRVAAFSRRRETSIMRLVGASNFFIQLPFLMEAVIAALLGALVAVLAVVGMKVVLIDGVLAPTLPGVKPIHVPPRGCPSGCTQSSSAVAYAAQ